MIKDQDFLKAKAAYCLDVAKKIGASDASVTIGHSISETVNFRNKNLDESNRSDGLAFSIDTYIGKKKSSISSSNLLVNILYGISLFLFSSVPWFLIALVNSSLSISSSSPISIISL